MAEQFDLFVDLFARPDSARCDSARRPPGTPDHVAPVYGQASDAARGPAATFASTALTAPGVSPTGDPGSRSPGIPEPSPATIQRRLRAAGVHGHDAVVDYLSLVGCAVYRESGPRRARILLVGPPSAGKTYLLERYAHAAELGPVVQIDASAISPEGWAGAGPSDLLSVVYENVGRDLARMRRVVLCLDEIDKAVRHADGDPLGSSVRRDRQASLLQLLWGGTPIRFSSHDATRQPFDLECRTDDWLIVACGSFADAAIGRQVEPPTDEQLVAYGMTREFASRLTTRLVLPARSAAEVAALLHESEDGLAAAAHVCARFGFRLHVADAAVCRVAAAVAGGVGGLTLRVGTQLLVDGANRALLQALADRAAPGTVLLVTPDDVPLPARSRAGDRGPETSR